MEDEPSFRCTLTRSPRVGQGFLVGPVGDYSPAAPAGAFPGPVHVLGFGVFLFVLAIDAGVGFRQSLEHLPALGAVFPGHAVQLLEHVVEVEGLRFLFSHGFFPLGDFRQGGRPFDNGRPPCPQPFF